MLEDLSYGNTQPCDFDSRKDPRLQPLVQKVSDAEKALRTELVDSGKAKMAAFAEVSSQLDLLMMNLMF